MCELSSVKFDKMVVNTDLALEYFKQKKNAFESSIPLDGQVSQDSDGHNKIVTTSKFETTSPFDLAKLADVAGEGSFNIIHNNKTYEKLVKLAKLVEKNAELFGQIEYLIRDIPVDDVKNYDVKLLAQNLTCRSFMTVDRYVSNIYSSNVLMDANSPLANIGFIAQLLMKRAKILILATKQTAAVSYLFYELCREVELDTIDVIFVAKVQRPNTQIAGYNMTSVQTIMNGCVGVITERSDLDSAVDAMLRTTTKYPWKITRIYVQESIYDKFKKVMAWKAGLTPQTTDDLDTLKGLSDSVYVTDGKVFLVDYAGAPNSTSGKVIVEAYRTTKELINLVTKYKALYISLWSNVSSEANEIATKVPSSIVWINGYGIFDGPSNASQAIYKELIVDVNANRDFYIKKDFIAKRTNWSQKTFDDRRKTIFTAVAEFLEKNKNDPFLKEAKDLMMALSDLESDDFARVDNSRVCMGLSIPHDFLYIPGDIEWHALYIAKLLTTGSALINDNGNEYLRNVARLCPDIPISSLVDIKGDYKTKIVWGKYASRTKVIWTDYGTIFAN